MTRSFLPVVVAALESAGQKVVRARPELDGHGFPPEWHMSGPLDRGWVEEHFDLGPLARCGMGPSAEWWLVDARTSGVLYGSGEAVAYDPEAVDRAWPDRRLLGHVDAYPELRRRWAIPSVDTELAVLRGTPVAVRGPNLSRQVTFAGSADEAIDRVREVLTIVLPSLTDAARVAEVAALLPRWFVEACAPGRRTPDEWAAWAIYAHSVPGEIRLRRWEARWTIETWLQAMLRAERTWWLADVDTDGTTARFALLTGGLGAPTSSLSWLLHVCGATDCKPQVPEVRGSLEIAARSPQRRQDPDDELAAAAHELLGLPDPLVLKAVAGRGGVRWEQRLPVPIDVAALERGLPADSALRFGSTARVTYVANGVSTICGPLRVPAPARTAPWWRRRRPRWSAFFARRLAAGRVER